MAQGAWRRIPQLACARFSLCSQQRLGQALPDGLRDGLLQPVEAMPLPMATKRICRR